jgi:sigma-54 dependent transcriptional regulator
MSEQHPAKLLAFPQLGEAPTSSRGKTLVFSDPSSVQLCQQLERIAASGASVLILGETGTGKELAARYLHDHSRRSGPFAAVNCGAFSDSMVEADLFGHEAGAFTGAQHARSGWFEVADGGTLFLDEIGDMPPALQVKLLRVLQEGQVVRLGSRKAVSVDIRVIAATNLELDSAVESGRFRRDLYYRLNVVCVRLLPLRERRADILPLAKHFLDLYRRRLGLERASLTAAAERALLAHGWPGNIRELENVVHYGLIMSRNGVLEIEDLRLGSSAAGESPSGGGDEMVTLGHGLRRLLDSDRPAVYEEVERLLVTTAFAYCAGNQVRTAQRLGISRNIVRAQLKRFGLLGQNDTAGSGEEAFVVA